MSSSGTETQVQTDPETQAQSQVDTSTGQSYPDVQWGEMHARWVKLEVALRMEGVPYRNDSRLSHAYVKGSLDLSRWTAEAVARECALMFWLYNYTNYPVRVSNSLRTMDAYFERSGDWEVAWRQLNQVAHAKIKEECIAAYGGIPQRWPWNDVKNTKITENAEKAEQTIPTIDANSQEKEATDI
jgi:hypothetical protein